MIREYTGRWKTLLHAAALRHWPLWTLALAFAALWGCASGEGVVSEDDSDVQVAVSLDKKIYRPGEPMIAKVSVTNQSGHSLDLRKLNFGSVEFYYGPTDGVQRAQRWPVYSRLETDMMFDLGRLEPENSTDRNFLLTRLSGEPGDFLLTVGYDQDVPAMLPEMTNEEESESLARPHKPTVWSKAVSFTVGGARVANRDELGILMKEDAIEICRTALKKPVSSEDAQLIWDEAGFQVWWVCLTVAPEFLSPGESSRRAYFVDPYRARIDQRRPAPIQLTYLSKTPKDETRTRGRFPGVDESIFGGARPAPREGGMARRGAPNIE